MSGIDRLTATQGALIFKGDLKMIEKDEDVYVMPLEAIEYLERSFPDKIVTAEQSPYEQGYTHGIINLIRALRADYELALEDKKD